MGPQLLPWHSQCQGSARAQAPNGEVRGGYPADCIAPASPDHKTKVKSQVSNFASGAQNSRFPTEAFDHNTKVKSQDRRMSSLFPRFFRPPRSGGLPLD